jgi:hypothetical protein
MLHVAPLLPTDPADAQQVLKKKHIGNDHVHIVWCEGDGDYSVSTITSQFNQAHIIIYPIEAGLFRVDVKWRAGLNWFGPLRWPVVVTKRALPALVRTTAVAAMEAFYRGQSPFAYPQAELVTAEKQALEKFATNRQGFDAIESVLTMGLGE